MKLIGITGLIKLLVRQGHYTFDGFSKVIYLWLIVITFHIKVILGEDFRISDSSCIIQRLKRLYLLVLEGLVHE